MMRRQECLWMRKATDTMTGVTNCIWTRTETSPLMNCEQMTVVQVLVGRLREMRRLRRHRRRKYLKELADFCLTRRTRSVLLRSRRLMKILLAPVAQRRDRASRVTRCLDRVLVRLHRETRLHKAGCDTGSRTVRLHRTTTPKLCATRR